MQLRTVKEGPNSKTIKWKTACSSWGRSCDGCVQLAAMQYSNDLFVSALPQKKAMDQAPRVYAPSWMQRPMEAVRIMPQATAPTPLPVTQLQLPMPQGVPKRKGIDIPIREMKAGRRDDGVVCKISIQFNLLFYTYSVNSTPILCTHYFPWMLPLYRVVSNFTT